MEQKNRTYIAIDLKSFYASVECIERGLDPLDTNLVVADPKRTEKTICLAVSPALKTYGVSGRPRLFEVIQKVREINNERISHAPKHAFSGSSVKASELKEFPEFALDYIVAPPRMALYLEYSTRIYEIYLKYIAPEDCHVYSIDEIMMDVTAYLNTSQLSAREFAETIIRDISVTTGITATAGIGSNLYLCKVAMDIVAKHAPPNKDGMRIASLDEKTYRRLLWNHRPLTDFWRVGAGYANKLEEQGIYTMGDIARCSCGTDSDYYNEELLYKLFGINAELLIDHAWGWEPCTMKDIKEYRPDTNSICFGQVLQCPYPYEKAKLVVREMAELLSLDLVEKQLVTNQIVLTVGYDRNNIELRDCREMSVDNYGRSIPKHAHGTHNLSQHTSSANEITDAVLKLFDRIINPGFFVRRISISANHVVAETFVQPQQLDLFTDYEKKNKEREKEKKLQKTMLEIKHKFGKNAVLKGTNLMEGATAIERNQQIGGHRA